MTTQQLVHSNGVLTFQPLCFVAVKFIEVQLFSTVQFRGPEEGLDSVVPLGVRQASRCKSGPSSHMSSPNSI